MFLTLLTVLCAVPMSSCNNSYDPTSSKLDFNSQDNSNYWGNDNAANSNTPLDSDIDPNIDITVIGGSSETEISKNITDKSKIVDVVFESVIYNLQTCGFKIQQFRKIGAALGLKQVYYTYILSDWFEQPKYQDVLDYIQSVPGCDYQIIKEAK